MKGAPEILLSRTSSYVNASGVSVPLDAVARERIQQTKDQWASQGRRVLLLARKVISSTVFRDMSEAAMESAMNKQASSGLTLVGLVGIIDPPRPEIPEVIDTLRIAGIRIFMVQDLAYPHTPLLGNVGL